MAFIFLLGFIYVTAAAHAQSETTLAVERLLQLRQDVSEVLSQAFSPKEVVPRFFEGSTAGRYAYPWHVIIHHNYEKLINGVLLNEWTVLAPASEFRICTNPDVSSFSVDAGLSKGYKRFQLGKVGRLIFHPDHENSESHVGNNLLLIHLKKPFEITKGVKPVRLSDATYDRVFLNTGNCKLAGMGPSGPEPSEQDFLVRELQMGLIGARACRKIASYIYPNYWWIRNRQNICGISEQAGICDEHVGSPLVCYDGNGEARLVGLTLYQPSTCALPPHFFTKVAKYRNWLMKNAKGELMK